MSVTRQLAEAIEFIASAVKDLSEAIYERIEYESKRITALEDEIERLKKEPHKSFRQKIKEKQ